MALRRFILAVAGAAAFFVSPAFAAPPAALSTYLPTICQPGVPGDCKQATPVSNPDGSNINGTAGANSPTSNAASSAQLSGTAIDLQGAGGAQIQIIGLNADSLAITQGMGPVCSTATYVTATVLKNDLSTTAAGSLTGASANGIYSIMVFGGCLKITRTGSADTLTVLIRSTN